MKTRLQSLLIPLLLIPLFASCATVRQRLGATLITPEVERQLGEQVAAQLGAAGAMARFSRDDERQSDQYAVRYLAATGYDPSGLLTFFQKLQKLEGGKRSEVEKLLATHPTTRERINRIEKMITRSGAEGGKLEKERFLRQTAALRR